MSSWLFLLFFPFFVQNNHKIKQVIISTGETTTVAGSAQGFADAQTGDSVRFDKPEALVLSQDGLSLFVADTFNHCIRQVEIATGLTTTLAGIGDYAGYVDGLIGSESRFHRPAGIALSSDGLSLFVGDRFNYRVRRVWIETGQTTTLSGGSESGWTTGAKIDPVDLVDSQDSEQVRFNEPSGVAVSPDGLSVFVADTFNSKVRQVITLNTTCICSPGTAGVPKLLGYEAQMTMYGYVNKSSFCFMDGTESVCTGAEPTETPEEAVSITYGLVFFFFICFSLFFVYIKS